MSSSKMNLFFCHLSQLNSKKMAKKLLHDGYINSLKKFIITLFFTMTELSGSDDVSMVFQKYIEERNSKFLISNFHL